ncbi:hypothetical protein DFJ73DRAFT_8297 [Zopfochytrium polystomum]|nr:hypothetical protein DFJ73DRAFT_8297 [Zopfochytrium polystomum]
MVEVARGDVAATSVATASGDAGHLEIRTCDTIVQSFQSGNAATFRDCRDWTASSCWQHFPATPQRAGKTCDSIYWWYATGGHLWWQDYVDWCTYECNTNYPCGLGRTCDSITCRLSEGFPPSDEDVSDLSRWSCTSHYPSVSPNDAAMCNITPATCSIRHLSSYHDTIAREYGRCITGYPLGGKLELNVATSFGKLAVVQSAKAKQSLERALRAPTVAAATAAARKAKKASSKADLAAMLAEQNKRELDWLAGRGEALQWMVDSAKISAAEANDAARQARSAAKQAVEVAAARRSLVGMKPDQCGNDGLAMGAIFVPARKIHVLQPPQA